MTYHYFNNHPYQLIIIIAIIITLAIIVWEIKNSGIKEEKETGEKGFLQQTLESVSEFLK